MYSNRLPLWPDPVQMTEADPAKIIEHLTQLEVSEAAERANRALRTFVETAGAAGMVVTALQRAAIVNHGVSRDPQRQLVGSLNAITAAAERDTKQAMQLIRALHEQYEMRETAAAPSGRKWGA